MKEHATRTHLKSMAEKKTFVHKIYLSINKIVFEHSSQGHMGIFIILHVKYQPTFHNELMINQPLFFDHAKILHTERAHNPMQRKLRMMFVN